MTFPANIAELLLDACRRFAEQKILSARENMRLIAESVNDETKSTAGDKHETGRAMAQLEQEKASHQLVGAERLGEELSRITLNGSSRVGIGSVVITNNGNFFIAAPAGTLNIGKISFFAISLSSPLGQQLKGKQKGEKFDFNGRSYLVEQVI